MPSTAACSLLHSFAGGASSLSWHLPHSLPGHCSNHYGYLQGVQRAIQSLPHCESLACPAALPCSTQSANIVGCGLQLRIHASSAIHAASGVSKVNSFMLYGTAFPPALHHVDSFGCHVQFWSALYAHFSHLQQMGRHGVAVSMPSLATVG